MKWKEIKLIALQKMFLITGNEIIDDETTHEYLSKMWAPCNEAMLLLATAGKFISKSVTIDLNDEKVIKLSKTYVDMPKFVDDFYSFNVASIYLNEEKFARFNVRQGNIMVLDAMEGTLEINYFAYPKMLTSESDDEMDIDLDIECCVLIPMYIASELFKDDDNSMATIYRNEFETGVERLKQRLELGKVRFVPHGTVQSSSKS